MKRLTANHPKGFTIVEVLVSSTLIVIIMGMLFGIVDNTQKLWKKTTSSITQFQSARAGFDTMTRRLSQATLNTYWKAPNFDQALTNFIRLPGDLATISGGMTRQSELQFLCGPAATIFKSSPNVSNLPASPEKTLPGHGMFFQAPLGYTEVEDGGALKFRQTDRMLMGCGYFVEFGPDPTRPAFLNRTVDDIDMKNTTPSRERFRLMELNLPSEQVNMYERAAETSVTKSYSHVLDASRNYYQGLVKQNYSITSGWVRPLWLEKAFDRENDADADTARFKYARPVAENIVAMIIMPKVPSSTVTSSGSSDGSSTIKGSTVDATFYAYDSWRPLRDVTTQTHLLATPRENLLPSVVQVTMVAIDEPSAARMELSLSKPGDIPDWLQDDHGNAIFQRADNYAEDLQGLEARLRGMPGNINYRVFTMDVVIRGSKWSKPEN